MLFKHLRHDTNAVTTVLVCFAMRWRVASGINTEDTITEHGLPSNGFLVKASTIYIFALTSPILLLLYYEVR